MTDWSKGVPLKVGEKQLGIYQPSPETLGYWQGVQVGELRLRYCPDCRTHLHPRRIVCSNCQSTNLIWRPASGRGHVYTFSEVHHATGEFKAAVPYVVGIVRLEEGVYLFTRIVCDDASDALMERPVSLDFRVLEQGETLPVFVVDASAGSK